MFDGAAKETGRRIRAREHMSYHRYPIQQMNVLSLEDSDTSSVKLRAIRTTQTKWHIRLTLFFSRHFVNRHCPISVGPHRLPYNAVDAITANNYITSLYSAIRKKDTDLLVIFYDARDSLLSPDHALIREASEHSLQVGTPLHIEERVSIPILEVRVVGTQRWMRA